jgi:hypothetical protein
MLVLVLLAGSAFAQPPRNMLVDGPEGRSIGLPIHWTSLEAALLQPNGKIQIFETQQITNHKILPEFFQPQSLQDARQELQAEVGDQFDTFVSGPYVIAAPRGQAGRWDARFKTMLAGYLRFFRVRGWPLRKPDFPLTVIVLPSREAFLERASREVDAGSIMPNLAGMYVPRTNRCLLYQVSHGKDSTNWQATEETVVHEAVHQLAYNTGIHERLFKHPLWFVEGLATMFEVPAVYDSDHQQNSIESRYHPEKMQVLQRYSTSSQELGMHLTQLIESDSLFRSEPQLAYALGWGLSFYLVERMPRQYVDFISLQRERGFQQYGPADRLIDFRQAFQTTPEQISPQILRLLNFR